jgi:hypothetical protein
VQIVPLSTACNNLVKSSPLKQSRSLLVRTSPLVMSLVPVTARTRTSGLESPRRYLLPFLPCAALIFGLILRDGASCIGHNRLSAIAFTIIVLQCGTSLAINQIYLAPTLQRFENEYADTVRSGANYLAGRIHSPEQTVLAVVDVGGLAYAANGRFRIYDGGGLASPELAHLTPAEQVQRVKPDYLIQSQGARTAEWEGTVEGSLHSIWSRRYKQHSVSQRTPDLFANIYSVSLSKTLKTHRSYSFSSTKRIPKGYMDAVIQKDSILVITPPIFRSRPKQSGSFISQQNSICRPVPRS